MKRKQSEQKQIPSPTLPSLGILMRPSHGILIGLYHDIRRRFFSHITWLTFRELINLARVDRAHNRVFGLGGESSDEFWQVLYETYEASGYPYNGWPILGESSDLKLYNTTWRGKFMYAYCISNPPVFIHYHKSKELISFNSLIYSYDAEGLLNFLQDLEQRSNQILLTIPKGQANAKGRKSSSATDQFPLFDLLCASDATLAKLCLIDNQKIYNFIYKLVKQAFIFAGVEVSKAKKGNYKNVKFTNDRRSRNLLAYAVAFKQDNEELEKLVGKNKFFLNRMPWPKNYFFVDSRPQYWHSQITEIRGSSPIAIAIKNGNISGFKFLYDLGLKYNFDLAWIEYLNTAAACNQIDIARELLDSRRQRVSATTWRECYLGLDSFASFDSHPLAQACMHGHLEMVKLLLDRQYTQTDEDYQMCLKVFSIFTLYRDDVLLVCYFLNQYARQVNEQKVIESLYEPYLYGRLPEFVKCRMGSFVINLSLIGAAAVCGSLQILDYFIRLKHPVTGLPLWAIQSIQGNQLLELAIKYGVSERVALNLLNGGAQYQVDNQGNDIIELCRKGWLVVLRVIIEKNPEKLKIPMVQYALRSLADKTRSHVLTKFLDQYRIPKIPVIGSEPSCKFSLAPMLSPPIPSQSSMLPPVYTINSFERLTLFSTPVTITQDGNKMPTLSGPLVITRSDMTRTAPLPAPIQLVQTPRSLYVPAPVTQHPSVSGTQYHNNSRGRGPTFFPLGLPNQASSSFPQNSGNTFNTGSP
jgi:ankyrin repeat protein